MDHSHHQCEHASLAHCHHCNVVYCKSCKQEWGQSHTWTWPQQQWPYPYTWISAGGTAGANTLYDTTTGATCAH